MNLASAQITAAGTNSSFFVSIPMIILGILILIVYFIPTFVAHTRKHLQKNAILILNIFLGWTFIGWVVALVWSVLKTNNNQ
ncbi:MAG: superinfection immunity protein [Clostridia bacterium]|nr:superinfection immunity protein [Clostridia bacterium]